MADLTARVNAAAQLLNTYGAVLDEYRGGCPAGFLAEIMRIESGGNFNSPGDPSIGEVGYFQVATKGSDPTPQRFGVDTTVAFTPEGNVFLGCLEYQDEAQRIQLLFPDLIGNGSADQWMFARTIFAVGRYGTVGHMNRAVAAGAIGSDTPYTDYVNWCSAGNWTLSQAWLQSRVIDVLNQWIVGQTIDPTAPDAPQRIPAFTPYSFPADTEPFISTFGNQTLITVALVGAAIAAAYLIV